ncbi:MAG: hypothetical protein P3M74_00535 [Candidatus Hodgkinia cicadicola]|nr:MAG: hypothetical protein P3M74_00535 [Candidatus Hodgkinia cicadicola]
MQTAIDVKHTISATKVTAASVGADEAVLLKLSNASADALTFAKLIKRLVTLENHELVLVGSQSSDNEGSQVGQVLASLLGWPLPKIAKLERCCEGCFRASCSIDIANVWFLMRRLCVMVCYARMAKPKLLKLSGLVEAKKKQKKTPTNNQNQKEDVGSKAQHTGDSERG